MTPKHSLAPLALALLLATPSVRAEENPRITLPKATQQGTASHVSFSETIEAFKRKGLLAEVKLPSGDHRLGLQLSFTSDPSGSRYDRKQPLKARAYCSVELVSKVEHSSGDSSFELVRVQDMAKPDVWSFSLSTPKLASFSIKNWQDVRANSVTAEFPYSVDELRGKVIRTYCQYNNHGGQALSTRALTLDGRTVEGTEKSTTVEYTQAISFDRNFTYYYLK